MNGGRFVQDIIHMKATAPSLSAVVVSPQERAALVAYLQSLNPMDTQYRDLDDVAVMGVRIETPDSQHRVDQPLTNH